MYTLEQPAAKNEKDESFEDAVGMKILRVNSVTLKFILKHGLYRAKYWSSHFKNRLIKYWQLPDSMGDSSE